MAQVHLNKETDRGNAWQYLVNGWHTLRDKAAHAVTYFSPEAEGEARAEGAVAAQRWGVLATDVVEHGDDIQVELELPGLDKSDLSVDVVHDRLVIKGHKKTSNVRRDGAVVITERAFGSFQRIIPLPDRVDTANTKASYENGVLTVTLPKHQSRKPRSIQISTA